MKQQFKHNEKELNKLFESISNESGNTKTLSNKLTMIKSFPSYASKLNNLEINEILNNLVNIINIAEEVIKDNVEDEWDKMTVKRDIKQIEENKKILKKGIIEFKTLQQRIYGVFDEIMFKFSRYFNFKNENTI